MRFSTIASGILALFAILAAFFLGFSGNTAGALIAGILGGWFTVLTVLTWDLTTGLALTALSAMGVSLWLVVEHLTAKQGQASICAINSVFDCDKVNTSSYSLIFDIPVAVYGFAFYAAIALVAILGRLGRSGYPHHLRLVRLAGIFSILFTVYMIWASTQVGAWCLFCMSLYGLNLMMLGGAWVAVSRADKSPGATPAPSIFSLLLGGAGDRSTITAVIMGALSFAAAVLVFQALKPEAQGETDSTPPSAELSELTKYYNSIQGSIQLDGSEPVFGDPNAPFLVVEWADFACPYCAVAAKDFKDLIRRNPQIQLRFKHYPISGNCNRFVKGPRHATACEAAAATDCAQKEGKFWEMSSLIFKNQEYQKSEDLRFIAKQIGLDMAAFETCMTSPAIEQGIKADIEAASMANLHGTPTFFVKGLYGDDYVQVRAKAEIVETLVKAVQSGIKLPPPKPAKEGRE